MSTLRIKNSWKKAKAIMKGGKVNDLKPYNKLLYEYYKFINDGNRENNTIQAYIQWAVIFICFINDECIKIETVTKETVISFIYLIETTSHNVSFRKALDKSYLKSFLNWLYDNEYILFSGNQVIPKIIWHYDEALPSVYTTDELSRILDAVDISTNEII